MTKLDPGEKLAWFEEPWGPRAVSTFDGHDIMVVTALGNSSGIPMPTRMIFSCASPARC